MENSEKALRAEVTTSYLRLTDAAIRAATLPPGKSQHYLWSAPLTVDSFRRRV